jgi:K+-sensing histidine kinase KdpD
MAARVENGDDGGDHRQRHRSRHPPDDLRRIFEPFYTTKGRGKGPAWGLAICRELVAALGGSSPSRARPGRGSTFVVRLPRHGQGRPRGASGGG